MAIRATAKHKLAPAESPTKIIVFGLIPSCYSAFNTSQ